MSYLRLSQVGVLPKRQNTGSRNILYCPGLYFSDAKDLDKIRMRYPPTEVLNAHEIGNNSRLSTHNSLYLENSTR